MSGKTSYLAGLAAEESVARSYRARGCSIIAQRWRGQRGEIDIVARDGDTVVFIEVKKSKNFARAAERLSAAQINRLYTTAEQYLCTLPTGLQTNARFDVVLLDAMGQHQIVENALCA